MKAPGPHRPGAEGGRDAEAGLKMLGALLRLGARCPQGFTALEFAEEAGVTPTTGRSFLKNPEGARYAEAFDRTGGVRARGGRPANLYRVPPEGRAAVLNAIARIRAFVDAPASAPGEDEIFEPVALLESSVAELNDPGTDEARWRACREEADGELRACRAEARALREKGSPHATRFAMRVSDAATMLRLLDRRGCVPAVPRRQKGMAEQEWVREIVRKVGDEYYVMDLIAYERGLDGLSKVIIVSDSPAPADGAMRTMMEENLRRGVSYLFFVARCGAGSERVEAYRRFGEEMTRHHDPVDPMMGRIEIVECAELRGVEHIIFYVSAASGARRERGRMTALIRQGEALESAYLRVENESVVQSLYRLVHGYGIDSAREVKGPRPEESSEIARAHIGPSEPKLPHLRLVAG